MISSPSLILFFLWQASIASSPATQSGGGGGMFMTNAPVTPTCPDGYVWIGTNEMCIPNQNGTIAIYTPAPPDFTPVPSPATPKAAYYPADAKWSQCGEYGCKWSYLVMGWIPKEKNDPCNIGDGDCGPYEYLTVTPNPSVWWAYLLPSCDLTTLAGDCRYLFEDAAKVLAGNGNGWMGIGITQAPHEGWVPDGEVYEYTGIGSGGYISPDHEGSLPAICGPKHDLQCVGGGVPPDEYSLAKSLARAGYKCSITKGGSHFDCTKRR